MDKKSRELVMAKLYFKNKDYKMAEKSFNEYLTMNPEDVAALKLLAQVHEQSKRFDKAFEMYERCYLAEPDRSGTLLDICRVLLMNEMWLDHVDYRQWLNLAIKAFPSNPIVVNFKSFLSTLPSEDPRTSPKHETPARRGEDHSLLILEKLGQIEKKIEELRQATEAKELAERRLLELQEKLKEEQNKNRTLEERLCESQKATERKQEELISMTRRLEVSNGLEREEKKKLEKDIKPKQEEVALAREKAATMEENVRRLQQEHEAQARNDQEVEYNNDSSAPPLQKIDVVLKPSAFNTFSFSSNLFEESMKKFNIPTNNVWSSFTPVLPKPSEDEEGGDKEDGGENDEVVPNEELVIENTCDMTPIEIKTGEEDEDIVFEHRCKLFRFRDKEYKERGLGSIKVLKHKSTGKGRLIMRREAIGLVCLNCWDCNKVERVRDTQVRWAGIDASDGGPQATVFLAKFKTQELTDDFMSHLTSLFSDNPSSTNTSLISSQPETNSANDKPDVELVDPQLNQSLVDKARALKLPDLFYHELKNQDKCKGCDGCENED